MISVYGSRAVMPLSVLRGLLAHERELTTAIGGLNKRLDARETLLMRALHELALLRGEKDPRNFIRKQMGGRGSQPGRP